MKYSSWRREKYPSLSAAVLLRPDCILFIHFGAAGLRTSISIWLPERQVGSGQALFRANETKVIALASDIARGKNQTHTWHQKAMTRNTRYACNAWYIQYEENCCWNRRGRISTLQTKIYLNCCLIPIPECLKLLARVPHNILETILPGKVTRDYFCNLPVSLSHWPQHTYSFVNQLLSRLIWWYVCRTERRAQLGVIYVQYNYGAPTRTLHSLLNSVAAAARGN